MSGLSRFSFYPRDWITDRRDLTDRAKGFHIDLMAATYNRGAPLPYDEKYLCGVGNYRNVRAMRHVLKELLDTGKYRIVDGHLVNNRTMEELEKAQIRIEMGSIWARYRLENKPKQGQQLNKIKTVTPALLLLLPYLPRISTPLTGRLSA